MWIDEPFKQIAKLTMSYTTPFSSKMPQFPQPPEGNNFGQFTTIRSMQDFHYPPPDGYCFKKTLGVGGCGKVYLAEHILSGALFAVKCVRVINPYSALMAAGLWNEKEKLQTNRDQNIVTYFRFMISPQDQDIRYLFLEFMDKGSVRSLYSSNILDEITVRKCIYQVLNGLKHLHLNINAHRDIKGDNVLVNSNGFYKIADFGITKTCHSISSSPCLYTEGIGTDSHMAPEVKNVQSSYDMASDIWSLGCLVLEMFNRGPPGVTYDSDQCVKYLCPPSITSQCEDFIKCCLQFEPNKRFTAAALLRDHKWFKIEL